jgi:hypothetical protein
MLGEVKQAANAIPDDKDPAYTAYLKKNREEDAAVPRLCVFLRFSLHKVFPWLMSLISHGTFGWCGQQDDNGVEGERNYGSGAHWYLRHPCCTNI